MSDIELRYRRAEAVSRIAAERKLRNGLVVPHWVGGTSNFWYEHELREGREIRLVDTGRRTNTPAFDHGALAQALRDAGHAEADAADLELDNLRILPDPRRLTFSFLGKAYRYDTDRNALERTTQDPGRPDWVVSPDGQRVVFLRSDNLWVRELETGQERQLTSDGERWYPYATPTDSRANAIAGGLAPKTPRGLWSADSKRFFTLRTDDRLVGGMPYVEFAPRDGSLRPRVVEHRFAVPGDPHVPEMRFLVLDVESGQQVEARWAPVPAVRMYDALFDVGLAWWGADETFAYFVDVERGERRATVVEFDTRSGATRAIFSEETSTYLELGANVYSRSNLHYLPGSHELIWCSERSGRSQLYLYELHTGTLVRSLTDGDWRVRDVIRVDESRREVWFTVSDRPGSSSPTLQALARASLDHGNPVVVTPDNAEHIVLSPSDFDVMVLKMIGGQVDDVSGLSPDGRYVVETYGTPDSMPVSVLRDRDGKVLLELARGELDPLGFEVRLPQPFEALAADGRTPLHGVMYLPSDFSPELRYPVIDYIYGGPQVSNVPNLTFSGMISTGIATMLSAYAELGFVVIAVDGRGVAMRDRAFHEHSYGQIERASDIDDHAAAIRQLGERHPFMDLDRVGIYGFSGGGYATAGAMVHRPDFFKVGVAGGGNHDQRLFWHAWGERYQGLPPAADFTQQAVRTHAAKLEGKLLFVHGLVDAGCHPAALFQLTQALIDANKDFELVLLPQAGHEVNSYAIRRIWDFFVRHLAGVEPPHGIAIRHGSEILGERMKTKMRRIAAAAAADATSAQ